MFNTKPREFLKLGIILVVCLSIGASVLFLTGGISFSWKDGIQVNGKSSIKIDDKKAFDANNIKELFLHTTSTNIRIRPAEDDKITLHFYGTMSSSQKDAIPHLVAGQSQARVTAHIAWPNIVNIGFFNSDLRLDIFLPQNAIDVLECTTTSANLNFDSLQLKKLNFQSTSGNLNSSLKMLNGNLFAKSTSGKIHLGLPSDAQFALDLKTTSGVIHTKDFELTTTDTDQHNRLIGVVGNDKNKIVVETTSGDIEITK